MSQLEKIKEDFEKVLEGYYMQLVYLKDLIAVQEDLENHKEELKNAPNFALIAECGLIDSYMIAFAKLFDKSEKAMTIYYLLKRCEANLKLFRDEDVVKSKIEEYKLRLDSDEFLSYGIEIVRKRRDTMLAHNDKKYFGEKMAEDTFWLPKYYLWMMRDFVSEVLKFISDQLGFEPRHCTAKYDGDLKKIFPADERI